MSVAARFFVPAAFGLLLAGCAGNAVLPPRSDNQLDHLRKLEVWSLTGRLALSDGEQGGSGRLNWTQRPEDAQLRFSGAFGQGGWQLRVTPTQSRLELGDGQLYTDRELGRLLERTVGWDIPVDALTWWVRGLPAPEGPYDKQQGTDDRLTALQQFGWAVEYTAYTEVGGLVLPRKLTASRGQDRLKLVVKSWEITSPELRFR